MSDLQIRTDSGHHNCGTLRQLGQLWAQQKDSCVPNEHLRMSMRISLSEHLQAAFILRLLTKQPVWEAAAAAPPAAGTAAAAGAPRAGRAARLGQSA